jgi:hypothetical protein
MMHLSSTRNEDLVVSRAAVHQVIFGRQINRDNMGRTCSTHEQVLLKMLREGATWEIYT